MLFVTPPTPETSAVSPSIFKRRKDWLVMSVAAVHAVLAVRGFWDAYPLIRAWNKELLITLVPIVGFTITTAVIALALWRGKRWSRWGVVVLNGWLFGAMLWDRVFEHERMDLEDLAFAVLFGALTILALLPTFGRRLAALRKGVLLIS